MSLNFDVTKCIRTLRCPTDSLEYDIYFILVIIVVVMYNGPWGYASGP